MARGKKKNSRKNKRGTLGSLNGTMGEWCSEHWFLTFLLVSSAIGVVGSAVSSLND